MGPAGLRPSRRCALQCCVAALDGQCALQCCAAALDVRRAGSWLLAAPSTVKGRAAGAGQAVTLLSPLPPPPRAQEASRGGGTRSAPPRRPAQQPRPGAPRKRPRWRGAGRCRRCWALRCAPTPEMPSSALFARCRRHYSTLTPHPPAVAPARRTRSAARCLRCCAPLRRCWIRWRRCGGKAQQRREGWRRRRRSTRSSRQRRPRCVRWVMRWARRARRLRSGCGRRRESRCLCRPVEAGRWGLLCCRKSCHGARAACR